MLKGLSVESIKVYILMLSNDIHRTTREYYTVEKLNMHLENCKKFK